MKNKILDLLKLSGINESTFDDAEKEHLENLEDETLESNDVSETAIEKQELEKAKGFLLNKTIGLVRYMTIEEAELWKWKSRPLVIMFNDGTVIYSANNTGTDGGTITYYKYNKDYVEQSKIKLPAITANEEKGLATAQSLLMNKTVKNIYYCDVDEGETFDYQNLRPLYFEFDGMEFIQFGNSSFNEGGKIFGQKGATDFSLRPLKLNENK